MIDSLGLALASWLFTVNAWTALLLAFALVVDRALARYARASLRILLYAPVGLRALLPLSWSISFAHAPRVVTVLTPVAVIPSPVPAAAALAPVPIVTWHSALLAVYVAVAALLAMRAVVRRVRLARTLDTARPVSSIDAPYPVFSHPRLGPMVAGLLAPRIVVPDSLLDDAGRPALTLVLRHEVAHLRRHDAWLSAAMQLLLVAAWPVLPLWIAARRVRHLVELACDEAALADADAEERRRYGHALLEIAERGSFAGVGAGELHFGSTLRARIEALGSRSPWPRGLQACLVGLAVAALAACSSVGPNPTAGTSGPRADANGTPAGAAIAMTEDDLRHRCPDFIQRFVGWSDPAIRWMTGPVDGIPAGEVAYCRGADVSAYVEETLWTVEVRNVVGQMASDLSAAFERPSARGEHTLCPSDGPVPRQPQRRGEAYQPTADDWKGPGFSCMQFAMDAPMHFQYTLRTDAHGFVITAHAQRPKGDHTVEFTVVLRGEIKNGGVLIVAPNLEETWSDVP
jgi:beta-lactamase regulating signal transducer with metallopeptidase domain